MLKKYTLRTPRRSAAAMLAVCAWVLGIAGIPVLFQGCKTSEEKSPVLAQVGTSTLTLDDLRESFPAEYEQLIRREQYLDFIKRWIDDEAVFQQALKGKLESDPIVKRKLEKLRRKLLIEEFLARENTSEGFEPDEMSMNQYYEMHKEDFRRKVPEVKFAHMRLQSYKQAMDIRGKALGENFLALAAANSMDPAPESFASIGFKKQNELPPCLAQDIANARIGTVTLPIACPDGMYLVKVIERQEVGSVIPFPEAKEEISGILIVEQKDRLLESRIAKYKEGIAITFNLDQIPGQPDAPKAAETKTPEPQPEAKPAEPAKPVVKAKPAAPKPVAAKPVVVQPAAAKPIAAAAVPGQPADASAPVAAAPGSAQVTPADGHLPREPWQDKGAAAVKSKSQYQSQNAHKKPRKPGTGGDSADGKTPGAKASADGTTEPAKEEPNVKSEETP